MAVALLLAGCLPGPWDYTPEKRPAFRGIWVSAYAVADKHADNICFERLYSLEEAQTQAFAFYDSAEIVIAGTFSSGADSLRLTPLYNMPNCFSGDTTARFLRGQSYTLTARFVWDSAGTRGVVTTLRAVARPPRVFRVADSAMAPSVALTGLAFSGDLFTVENLQKLPPGPRAQIIAEYGDTISKLSADTVALNAYLKKNGQKIMNRLVELLQGDQIVYSEGDTSLFYIGGNAALNNLSHYLHSVRSDDVQGVLVTHRYDTTESRPETSFDRIFGLKPDTGEFYYPGDIRRLLLYPSTRSRRGYNVLDSMGVVNAWFFTGRNRLYFYGAEKAYTDFQFSNVQSAGGGDASDNPKIEALSNVSGGRGFFAGMVLDSFDILIKADSLTPVYAYPAARAYACREQGWFESRDCSGYYREFCRGNAWKREDCRLDAIYLALDSVDSLILPPDIRDSVHLAWSKDSLPNLEAGRRYCIDHDYPATVSACAEVKRECVDGKLGNGCQLILWKSCELAYWKPAACVEGRKSYCRDNRDVHSVLCRGVQAP